MLRTAGFGVGVRWNPRAEAAFRRSPVYTVVQQLRNSGSRGPAESEPPALPPHALSQVLHDLTTEQRELINEVGRQSWYHTIDLPNGITTAGLTDHRTQVSLVGLPRDMSGLRALDVATFDGFWAFEMERRGAAVVALDLPFTYDGDIPLRQRERLPDSGNARTGDGFRLAHRLLESSVQRLELNVYDLAPEHTGKFDVVFVSDLLLHLRDPQRALERIYTVVADDGYVILAEPYDRNLDELGVPVRRLLPYERYTWSIPSQSALRAMLEVSGFKPIEEVATLPLIYRGTYPLQKTVLKAYPWQARRAPARRNGRGPSQSAHRSEAYAARPWATRRRLGLGVVDITVSADEQVKRRLARVARVARRRPPQPARPADVAMQSPAARAAMPVPPESNELWKKVQDIEWYHCLELPGPIVTPGRADLRAEIPLYRIPENMTGMRTLDVATFDGYFAFEMERRGADVVAIDVPSFMEIDLPLRWKEGAPPELDVATGAGFALAREALGSNVDRRTISVYDLSIENVGLFDFALMSDLLQHLRDPQRALERLFTVLKPGGALLLAEVYDEYLDSFDEPLIRHCLYESYCWALPSERALRLMLEIAGFEQVEEVSRPPFKYQESTVRKVVLTARRPVA